jgi:ribulose-phosphate 3-epimerase
VEFKKAGCDVSTAGTEYEAALLSTTAHSPSATSDKTTTSKDLIEFIHAQGMKAGIAIKPKTTVDVLWDPSGK